ncbi:hypothetical protein EV426DRAFT_621333 [Tirmania nivea]|nr:hypothetical protein EV426DRAFT_621333 [Tirmania nivea]
MSGMEIAGLVLATFPIVIECLNKMKKGNRRVVLIQLARELKVEMTIFKNSWNRLLQLAGEDSITGESLDPDTVSSIVDICEDLLDSLENLKHRVEKYGDEGTTLLHAIFNHSDEYCNEKLTRIHRLNENLDKLVNGAQFQLSFKTTHTKVVNAAQHYKRMRDHAKMIHDALKEKLETSTCGCSHHSANLRLQMRYIGKPNRGDKDAQSQSLSMRFSVIFAIAMAEQENRWRNVELERIENVWVAPQCQTQLTPWAKESTPNTAQICHMHGTVESGASGHTRSVNMPSEVPTDGSMTSASSSTMNRMTLTNQKDIFQSLSPMPQSPSPKFTSAKSLVLDRKQKPKSVSLKSLSHNIQPYSGSAQAGKSASVVTNTAQQTTAATTASNITGITNHIISCFCSRVREAEEIHCCLGIIVCKNAQTHRVWIPRQPLSIPRLGRAITLANMLHDLKPEAAPALEERLKLGVRLASSVLQLHNTEWLNERWNKEEIWFIQEDPCRNPILKYPLVRRAFQPGDKPASTNPIEAFTGRYNASLFSLGIALMEIWHWKSLETMDIGDGWKYYLELRGKAPASFTDAVGQCFHDLGHTETQLHLDDFKNAVYLKIVLPLEDTLKWFCGKDNLAQIFEEYST